MVSELRNLTKPAKVIAVVIAVLFACSGFLVRDVYYRVTGSSDAALAAVHLMDKAKLDRTVFEAECAVNQERLAKKVDRTEYEARHHALITRLDDSNDMMREMYRNQFGRQFKSKEANK